MSILVYFKNEEYRKLVEEKPTTIVCNFEIFDKKKNALRTYAFFMAITQNWKSTILTKLSRSNQHGIINIKWNNSQFWVGSTNLKNYNYVFKSWLRFK